MKYPGIRLTLTALLYFTWSISLIAAESKPPKRIVSAGGSITEIVTALGLGENLIAVDTSSIYPEFVTKLPQIGYFRSLGSEGILSLDPDLLVAARGAGPDKVLAQIKSAGVGVVQFEQSIYTLENWENLVLEIGAFFDRETKATKLITRTRTGIEVAAEKTGRLSQKPRVLTLLNAGNRGFTVAGKNTVPDLLLNLLGASNVAAEIEGYKPMDPESLANEKVDLILAPHHTLEAMGGVEGICSNLSIRLATSNACKLHVMNALLLLGFGARLDVAALEIAELLAP